MSKARRDAAEEADFRFWYEGLTPKERVAAVADALESCLKTRGFDGIPRLRRVYCRIRAPWAKPRGAQTPRRQAQEKAGRAKPTRTGRAVSVHGPEQELRRA